MIQESTAGQFLNFIIFLASLILTLNNSFDFRYKWNIYTDIGDNLNLLDDFMMVISSILTMYFTISSPYEDEIKTDNNESYISVILFCALLYNSTSVIIEDTDILYSVGLNTIFQGVSRTVNVSGFNGEFIEEVFDVIEYDKTITALGLQFILLVNMSKIISLIGALYYLAIIITNDFPSISRKKIIHFFKSLPGRAGIAAIIIFNGWIYFNTLTSSDKSIKKNSFIHLKEIGRIRSIQDLGNFWMDPYVTFIFQDVISGLFLAASIYMLVFYDKYKLALLPTCLIILHNIIRADEIGYSDIEFSILVCLGYVMLTSLIVYSFSYFITTGTGYTPLYTATNLIPTTLYKLGIILTIIASCLLFVSFQYHWFDFEFQPSGIAKTAAEFIDDAVQSIEQFFTTLSDLALSIDPCTIRMPAVHADQTMTEDDIPARMQQARCQAKYSGYSLDRCMDSSTQCNIDRPFPFGHIIKCNKFDSALGEQEHQLREVFEEIRQHKLNLSMLPITSDDLDNELYVNEKCKETQCIILTSVVIFAMAISWVPFISGIGPILQNMARAAYDLFKIGRKLIKYLPRMRTVKKTVSRLSKRIRALATIGKNKMGFSYNMAIIFLPVIVSAAIGLTLIMFKRQNMDEKSAKIQLGLKLIVSIILPVILFEFAFLVVSYFFPIIVQDVLNELPTAFIKGDMEIFVGYRALQFSYLISLIGNIMVFISAVSFSLENGIFGILNIFKGFATNFLLSFKEWKEHRKARRKNKNVATGAKIGIKKRVRNLISNLLNWNARYMQPFIFSLPVLYLVWLAHSNSDIKYVRVYYKANQDSASAQEDLSGTLRQDDMSSGLDIDLNDSLCGPVGEIIKLTLNALGGLDFIKNIFSGFLGNITKALGSITSFLTFLTNLIKFPKFDLNVKLFSSSILENIVVFFIPLLSTITLGIIWVISLIYKEIQVLNPFTRVEHNPSINDLLDKVSIFIMSGALINIAAHYLVGSLILTLANNDLPYIAIHTDLSDKYYMTILCSIFNMISAVAIYVNSVIPPQ